MLKEIDTELRPGVFECCFWLETYIRDNVTDPLGNMENIFQADRVTFFASCRTTYLDLDGSDTTNRDRTAVGHSESITLEGCVRLEDCSVDGYVDIGS
jgi:hypothetical protein